MAASPRSGSRSAASSLLELADVVEADDLQRLTVPVEPDLGVLVREAPGLLDRHVDLRRPARGLVAVELGERAPLALRREDVDALGRDLLDLDELSDLLLHLLGRHVRERGHERDRLLVVLRLERGVEVLEVLDGGL